MLPWVATCLGHCIEVRIHFDVPNISRIMHNYLEGRRFDGLFLDSMKALFQGHCVRLFLLHLANRKRLLIPCPPQWPAKGWHPPCSARIFSDHQAQPDHVT